MVFNFHIIGGLWLVLEVVFDQRAVLCRVVLCMQFLVLNKRWSLTRGVSQRRNPALYLQMQTSSIWNFRTEEQCQ